MTFVLNEQIRFILTMIIVVILCIILVRFRETNHSKSSSLQILEKRYNRGEISKEAFEEAKRKQGK